MDTTAVRWTSLGVIAAMTALASWALSADSSEPSDAPATEPADYAINLELRPPGSASQMVIAKDGAVAGRSRACDIVLDDPTVSKRHACFHARAGQAYVEDLQSTNGTLVNGKRIGQRTALRRGDRIGLGANLIVMLGITQPSLNRKRL